MHVLHVQYHVFFDLFLKVCDLSPKDTKFKQTIVDPCLSCFVFVTSLKTNIYIYCTYYSVLERGYSNTVSNSYCTYYLDMIYLEYHII